MRVHVKICGIRDVAGAMAAIDAGADSVGLVMAASVRQVDPAVAAHIIDQIPGWVEKVAVFSRPTPGEVGHVLRYFTPDLIQADHDSLPDHPSIRMLPVFRESPQVDLTADIYLRESSERRFLYEGPRSGIGVPVDWERARRLALFGDMSLAGGLTPENVAEAIHRVRPYGVDVSSGVESEPGVKDHGRIREFLEAVRESEKEMVCE